MSERLNDDADSRINPPGRKVWLDDMRKEPIGWFRAHNYDECLELLQRGDVIELSLDHDLADIHYAMHERTDYSCPDPYAGSEKTGYHVVLWMCENNVWPPVIRIHSMSTVGRQRMEATIRRYAPEETILIMMQGGAHPPV